MKFDILTLFPEIIDQYCTTSILGKAQLTGKITVSSYNIRNFSQNKHKKVDDIPYGGGAGMVIQCDPVYRCYDSIPKKDRRLEILLSPQGEVFNHAMALEMSHYDQIILFCGHYEGFDERIRLGLHLKEVSIGNFVLTGGELPALLIIDTLARLIEGTIGNEESVKTDSLYQDLLKYPQYTRPEEYQGMKVPEILLSGHHKNIEEWRYQQALIQTNLKRPDLLTKLQLSDTDRAIIDNNRKGFSQ